MTEKEFVEYLIVLTERDAVSWEYNTVFDHWLMRRNRCLPVAVSPRGFITGDVFVSGMRITASRRLLKAIQSQEKRKRKHCVQDAIKNACRALQKEEIECQ